jgi:hypothetical protein
MTKMVFGALVASILIGLAGVAIAGSPGDLAKSRKQKPAKLKLARVHAALDVAPGQVSPLTNIPCPKHHRVVSGSVSPGATLVAVDTATPGREGWTAAVGNPADFTAHWSVDVICARGANRYMKVTRGGNFVASKRQLQALRRAAKARLR